MIELAQPARPVRAVKSDLHAEPVIEVAQGVQRIDVKRQIAEELETADGYDDGQPRLIRIDPDVTQLGKPVVALPGRQETG